MKKTMLGMVLACTLGFGQGPVNKLEGKRIYLHRKNASDHSDGYTGLRNLLESRKAAYGYTFEYTSGSANEADLNALMNRLHKTTGTPAADRIDILIFCQGQGDQNVGGGTSTSPFTGAAGRFAKVNDHVKAGGSLILVHAAAGREISWQGWWFGARLLGDWFHDAYSGPKSYPGNGGHYPYLTEGTYALDEETQASHDPSTSFIRKVFTAPKTGTGFAQTAVSPTVKGEWYHFNAGKKYEGDTVTAAKHANNTIEPVPVRGDPGVPDSGIGPAKIVGSLTRIEDYVVPGKGRHGVWAREVSNGVFKPQASRENGRFLYFNPGHAAEEYTDAGGWMGDFFLACLRWVAKEDLGCTDPEHAGYNPLATVNDCGTAGLSRDGKLSEDGHAIIGDAVVRGAFLEIYLGGEGPHQVRVTKANGETLYRKQGMGRATYRLPDLERGLYLIYLDAGGRNFQKALFIHR